MQHSIKFNDQPTLYKAVIIALFLALILTNLAQLTFLKPYGGEFDKACIGEMQGKIDKVKSFTAMSDKKDKDGNPILDSSGAVVKEASFKFLWQYTPDRVYVRNEGRCVLPKPEVGRPISIDVKDSRANLYINATPTKCTDAGVYPVICEYDISSDASPSLVWTEELSLSSGLIEARGTPR